MKRLDISATIGAYTFPYANSVKVESSWASLTDTASMVVNRKVSMGGKTIAEGDSLFSRNDAVDVKLGYDGQYDSVFNGFVSQIKPGVPLEFSFEDAAILLKKNPKSISYKSATLKQILQDTCPIPFKAVDVDLGPFRLSNATPAQVLDKLRKSYGLQSWVRDGELYAGLAYWPGVGTTHQFDINLNIIEGQSELEYVKAKDWPIQVKAVSILGDSTSIEVVVGDSGGQLYTLPYYGITSKDTLRSLANAEIGRLRVNGYRGWFLTYGQPRVRHGDIVFLIDRNHPDRNGYYLVKRVFTFAGVGIGYRQKVYLDILV